MAIPHPPPRICFSTLLVCQLHIVGVYVERAYNGIQGGKEKRNENGVDQLDGLIFKFPETLEWLEGPHLVTKSAN